GPPAGTDAARSADRQPPAYGAAPPAPRAQAAGMLARNHGEAPSARRSNMDDGITRLEDIGAALYESAQPPLVTIYSPTHGLEARTTDRRRFEEMAARARERLAQRFERRERAGADRLLERLAERFDELAGPSADGALAAFVSNEGAFVCNLDRHVEPIVVVGDAFLVRPLLKELGFGSRYLLLGLSADRFALIRGSFGSLERVKLPADVPG